MILTVCNGRDQAEWFDILLPLETKALDLLNQLRSDSGTNRTLLDEDNYRNILEGRHPDGPWFRIPDQSEIGQCGLRDGDFVRVQRTYSTVNEEV